jgi:hemolysin III
VSSVHAAQPPSASPAVKPRLRGVWHEYTFFASILTGTALVVLAPPGRGRTAAAVYAGAVCALFGASALYHRVTWSPPVRRWMRRLDHSMIFLLIAGTYTPFGLLVLSGTLATAVLSVVWAGAIGGVVLKLCWIDAPKWLVAGVYLALGWVAVAAMPRIAGELGATPVALLLGGGVAYSVGAVVYARGRPDPWPAVFGYHEVFHALVVLAAAAHYAVVAFFVLPRT